MLVAVIRVGRKRLLVIGRCALLLRDLNLRDSHKKITVSGFSRLPLYLDPGFSLAFFFNFLNFLREREKIPKGKFCFLVTCLAIFIA